MYDKVSHLLAVAVDGESASNPQPLSYESDTLPLIFYH